MQIVFDLFFIQTSQTIIAYCGMRMIPMAKQIYFRPEAADHTSHLALAQLSLCPAASTPALVKKIGKTTYIVRVHFDKTNRETMSDKIKRILRNKIAQM